MIRGAVVPRWLIIVQQSRPEAYDHLRDRFDSDGRVEVILDRRRLDPSAELAAVEVDGCWQERRTGERQGATVSDRRQHPRRESLGRKERALFADEGFFTALKARAG
jgi:hypothetical protein